MEFITKNTQETQKLAGDFVENLADTLHRGALVLALRGELGAGKTTFVQGLAGVLGVKEKILSPTFLIIKHFNILTSKHFKNLYHMDAYRLSGAGDVKGLGLEEILQDKNNLVVIEWAERVKDILPKDTLWLQFEHGGEDKRKITILNFKV